MAFSDLIVIEGRDRIIKKLFIFKNDCVFFLNFKEIIGRGGWKFYLLSTYPYPIILTRVICDLVFLGCARCLKLCKIVYLLTIDAIDPLVVSPSRSFIGAHYYAWFNSCVMLILFILQKWTTITKETKKKKLN